MEFFRLCVASAVAVSIFVVVTLLLWWEERRVPISVYFLSAMFASSLTLYSRLTYRMYRNTTLKKRLKASRRTLLIGAPLKLNKDTFFDHLATLKQIAYSNNSDNLVQALIDLVPTFHHAENNYD